MSGRSERSSDLGSGTVYALVVFAVLAAIGLGAATVGGAVVARHRAMAAADLAALAAADALARSDADPCAAAERIAARHAVELVGCTTAGLVVDVVVDAPVGGVIGLGLVAQMRARAGPSSDPDLVRTWPGAVARPGPPRYGRQVPAGRSERHPA